MSQQTLPDEFADLARLIDEHGCSQSRTRLRWQVVIHDDGRVWRVALKSRSVLNTR